MSHPRHNPVQWRDQKFEDRVQNMYGSDFLIGQHHVLRPNDIAVRFPFGPLLALVGLFWILKLIAVVVIGVEVFEAQRLELSHGTLPEKIGAALLQIDPITDKITEFVSAN